MAATRPLRIVFMGTPDFAVATLRILIENKHNVVGVITAPDKPAGRGQKIQESAVKKFAVENNLKILQPEKLKDEKFLQELKSLNADLQIVVAFRMLPEVVWKMPVLGTFNLHASLLPQYRGAAPINWAIINGEKETGITTFFLQHEIDTGKIIFQERVTIGESETAGELHDKLMAEGAKLVLKTVRAIEEKSYVLTDQTSLIQQPIQSAYKIFKETCKINWNNDVDQIYNLIRGLSPYPTAYSELKIADQPIVTVKIFNTTKEKQEHHLPIGSILTDGKTYLKAACKNGYVYIAEIQLAGKKRMTIAEFLRGFSANKECRLL